MRPLTTAALALALMALSGPAFAQLFNSAWSELKLVSTPWAQLAGGAMAMAPAIPSRLAPKGGIKEVMGCMV